MASETLPVDPPMPVTVFALSPPTGGSFTVQVSTDGILGSSCRSILEVVAAPVARTVEELRATLADLPGDLPLSVGYDWGGGLDLDGVTVRGEHQCDPDCDSDCVIAGTVLLEINPRPTHLQ